MRYTVTGSQNPESAQPNQTKATINGKIFLFELLRASSKSLFQTLCVCVFLFVLNDIYINNKVNFPKIIKYKCVYFY